MKLVCKLFNHNRTEKKTERQKIMEKKWWLEDKPKRNKWRHCQQALEWTMHDHTAREKRPKNMSDRNLEKTWRVNYKYRQRCQQVICGHVQVGKQGKMHNIHYKGFNMPLNTVYLKHVNKFSATFFQGISIACLFLCLSHADTESKECKLGSQNLHCRLREGPCSLDQ